MQPFTTVTGPAVPLMMANVDTDVIIRIERLTGEEALGPYAFEALRYRPDGGLNPDCVLNEPRFQSAPILLARRNFGCGSSREGAVTALMAMGFRCVIAPSFGDIFVSNCFQNGLLPVPLAEAEVERLAALSAAGDVTVDLERCVIAVSGHGDAIAFAVDPLRRESLLQGLDDIGMTLMREDNIAAWQAADRVNRPWVWRLGNGR